MKKIINLILLIVTIGAFAQNEEAEVKKTIESFFIGFHTQDSILIKSTLYNSAILQTIGKNREGTTTVITNNFTTFLKNIVGIPETMDFNEKITSYTIKVDGLMANAWTEYEFWVNGKFSHCGVNSFQLFKDNGKWKIIYLIDTRRKEGCN